MTLKLDEALKLTKDTQTFTDLTTKFISLSPEEKRKFYEIARTICSGKNYGSEQKLFTEEKFSDGIKCLKCGSKNVKKMVL